MAGRIFTVNFDEGIEKVEYSDSLFVFPTGEVTTTGWQSVSGLAEFFVRPIFKQGYELDTTNVELSVGRPDIYVMNLNGPTTATFTSKPIEGGGSMTFKHYFKGAKIGTGNIAFRDFAPVPTLAQVENVTVDGTTLSWDEVENATSYDIYADGTLIGNTDGGGGSSVEYKLTFTKNRYVNSVMVNGTEVESGYILQNGDVITVDTAGRTMKVNGESYEVGTTISLSDTDIQLEFTPERSTDKGLYTINFSIT